MEIVYSSVQELEQSLRDAAAAHGRHEAETGREDPDWPTWYADYMARTQTGKSVSDQP
ncbi:hypothetical protein ACIBF5_24640 [Micromonospora sp. NPDC050417]|uniref:hypothetical protein n=1 Tax=Micromonospora sp. NPDC050417 TaxID=3364280 RepID=UPI0037BDB10C